MFAKPAPRKPSTAVAKQKVQEEEETFDDITDSDFDDLNDMLISENSSKPKTLSVKTGVKTSQCKKTKNEIKKSLKPPPRQDAGYSLYSSDSEEQVSAALNDMETCEKLLSQIRSKQKETEKQTKTKGKKKKKDGSPLPKALNENPQRTDVLPGFSSIYGTTYPYGTALFLRQLQSQDYANSPIFNTRLVSSTPDPEKHLADISASKLPAGTDQVTRDVPERDVSAVSSVPPSFNHLQNMANMVDIYKQLEFHKATQLHEAAARAELEKFKAFQSASKKDAEIIGKTDDQGHSGSVTLGDQMPAENLQNVSDPRQGRQSDGFIATGSLGFSLPPADSAFRPVVPGEGYYDSNIELPGQQDSSLTAFQPYLSGDSKEILPPQAWINTSQGQGQVLIGHTDHVSNNNVIFREPVEQDIPLSGRTDLSQGSQGTDYVMLPMRTEVTEGQKSRSKADANVVMEKQNGLFQIREARIGDHNSSSNETKSEKTDSTGKGQGQSSLDEVPERESAVQVPRASAGQSQTSKDGTFRVEGLKNDSQNLSEITASTPRTQNMSGTGSTSTCGGKLVFIPNDSNTQNVIGFVPGLPILPGTNAPISLPVTNDVQGSAGQSGSILSSVIGQQNQSVSQVTAQGQGQNDGSRYSALHVQAIAAGDIGIRKLRYLLKELRECNKVNKDVEVNRLVTEIDETVNAIPQLALTFNLQTEIDLAIQPLRSENSQLRRKVRLLNQQIKDKELASSDEPKDINFEILHLQTSNEKLQKVLKEEKEIKTRLAAEVQYLYTEIHKMKVEKSKLIAQTSEKETEQLKVKQEMTLDYQKLSHDLDLVKKDREAILNKLESTEKENHILQITLKQRDDEIARQSEIVETMKESISELLGELEQSRIGEKTWDHNNSYGLHRLMKIVEEEGSGFSKEQTDKRLQRTPERRAFDFNISDSTTSTARLTQAALAYHDRRHEPFGGRLGPDGRQGPASESELDTLVEMHLKNLPEKGRVSRPCRRRHSSSSPVRLKSETLAGNVRHQRTASSPTYRKSRIRDAGGIVRRTVNSPQRENTIGQESDAEEDVSPTRRKEVNKKLSPYRRVPRDGHILSPERRAAKLSKNERPVDPANGSEISVEQSRYSVTDYFKKYHPQDTRPKEPQGERNLPPTGRRDRFPRDFIIGHSDKNNENFRSLFQTSSEIDEKTVKSSEGLANRYTRHGKFFKDDRTISAIHDDDNVSSVSMSSVTTANTVDDRKFRSGIANLDANIARLQQALQKTKSMLT